MQKQGKLSIKAIIALVFVFAGLVSVIAYGTNNPSVFGHSASEVDFTGMSGNIVTTGDVQANRVCIGTDCRSTWPTSSSNSGGSSISTGSPSLVFQAQRFIDDDTNYYLDINTGARIGGNWVLDGNLDVNGKVEANSFCIGSSCITSWPTSSSSSTNYRMFSTTVGTVESGCHDSSLTAQFMVTCGHRYCDSQGYETGFVVEYTSSADSATALVSCFK